MTKGILGLGILDVEVDDDPRDPENYLEPTYYSFKESECEEYKGIWDKEKEECKFRSREERLKAEISYLLFAERPERTDPELLTIIILREKIHYLEFLKAYTRWYAVGKWMKLTEKNFMITVFFKDTPDERIGNALIEKLREYNKYVIKEELLYATTEQLEETTMVPL